MIRYSVLGSGSAANSYIFDTGDFLFVIDNGFTVKEFVRRARLLKYNPADIKYLFLTHTHSDHLKGVAALSRTFQIPVYAHEGTDKSKLKPEECYEVVYIREKSHYVLGNLDIMPFSTSHDASCSLGYYFMCNDTRFTQITDTGIVTEEMYNCALRSDILFLESNYCEDMLHKGSYPYFLKRRISSDRGHLSNRAAARFLHDLSCDSRCKIEQVYLCHLSENNNTPEAVKECFQEHYKGSVPYRICERSEMVSSLAELVSEAV